MRLTVICRDTHTPYSGMLPGYVAGHYGYDDVHIDLRAARRSSPARASFATRCCGLDRDGAQGAVRDRPPVPYDRVSINIGSTPQMATVPGARRARRPGQADQPLQRALAGSCSSACANTPGPTRIAVVGGGAGGVELTLAMQYRLRRELRRLGARPGRTRFPPADVAAATSCRPTTPAVRRASSACWPSAASRCIATPEVDRGVGGPRCRRADGASLDADEIVWVTRAGGAPWLRGTGLALDDRRLHRGDRDAADASTDPQVFAAGDIASMVGHPLEKAGVFAVRQGRPLARNLRRAVAGRAARSLPPAARWLALISTGDRYAVASRGALGFAGALGLALEGLDRPSLHAPVQRAARPMPDGDRARRRRPSVKLDSRRGGAGDLGDRDALRRLRRQGRRHRCCRARSAALHPIERDDVLIGLHAPDDAAVVRVPPGKAMVHTVDFFRAFIDDPYVFGKVAANHALGDIFAMGAEAQSATAIVTVPPGSRPRSRTTLLQMMSGAHRGAERGRIARWSAATPARAGSSRWVSRSTA